MNNQEARDIAQKLISIAQSGGVSIRRNSGKVVISQNGQEYAIDTNTPKVNLDSGIRFK